MKKKLGLACWYGSIKVKDLSLPKGNLNFFVRGFWLPAPAWRAHNCTRYSLNNFFSPQTLFSSLRPLFNGKGLFPLLTFFSIAPRTSSFTTVTRGPMVRKKQSREQAGFSNRIAIAGFKASYFQCASFTNSEYALGAFFNSYWALFNSYLFSFNFLFFQQTSVVSAFLISWAPLLA